MKVIGGVLKNSILEFFEDIVIKAAKIDYHAAGGYLTIFSAGSIALVETIGIIHKTKQWKQLFNLSIKRGELLTQGDELSSWQFREKFPEEKIGGAIKFCDIVFSFCSSGDSDNNELIDESICLVTALELKLIRKDQFDLLCFISKNNLASRLL